jgi:hypothetical protein
MSMSSPFLLTAAVLAFALWAQAALAVGPQPPCGAASPLPAYAEPPAVRTWGEADLEGWTPPACLGWPGKHFRLIVALAGRFRHDGDADALLERFGAISTMRGLRYWSVTDNSWRILFNDASALAGPDPQKRRADFTLAELKAGGDLFFEQDETRSGSVLYRMRVLQALPDRLVIETENLTPVRAFFITLFPPRALRSMYFLERLDGGAWGFYGLSSTSVEASALASSAQASYINRAAALYRHFIGVPGDRDPPLAP